MGHDATESHVEPKRAARASSPADVSRWQASSPDRYAPLVGAGDVTSSRSWARAWTVSSRPAPATPSS